MAKEQLIIELIAESKNAVKNLKAYTKEAKRSGDQVGKLTKLFKNHFASIAAGVLIARKMIRVTKELVEAHNIQERAEAKLAAVLKSTGRDIIPGLIDSYTEYASTMQNITGVSDAVILDTQAMMATFTKISEDVMPAAMDALLNVSAVMGQDLRSTAIQLGKALNDPILGLTALRRIGIQLSTQQEESVKSFVAINDIASAQAVILGELQTQFGGAAEAMGKTMAGQAEILSQKIGDLKEQLGALVKTNMPAFIELTDTIVTSLSAWIERMTASRREIEKFKKMLGAMTKEELKENISAQADYIDRLLDSMHAIEMQIDTMKEQKKFLDGTGKDIKAVEQQLKDLDAEYLVAVNMQKQYKDALETVQEAMEKLKPPGDEIITQKTEEIVVVSQASDAWTRWAESMKGATDEAINFNKASRTTAEIITDMGDPLEAHRQRFRDIEMQLDNTTSAQKDLLDTTALYTDTMEAMANEIKEGQDVLKEMAKVGFASVLRAIGRVLIAQSALMWATPVRAALTLAAGFAAIVAANVILAMQMGGVVKQLQQGGGVKHLQTGGFGDRVPAMLEPGEVVIDKFTARQNAPAIGAMRGGEGGGRDINLVLDGRVLARWIWKESTNKNVTLHHGAVI